MPKTVEQKLASAKKKIKSYSKEIKAAKHLIKVRGEYIDNLKNEISVKDGMYLAAQMWIGYLISRLSEDGEVIIPQVDMYAFAKGYELEPFKDDESGTIIIRVRKRDFEDNNEISSGSSGDNEKGDNQINNV